MKLEDADWNMLEVYGSVVWLAHVGPCWPHGFKSMVLVNSPLSISLSG
jgi:hypothetical protein